MKKYINKLLTIVTVTYNCQNSIAKTFESIKIAKSLVKDAVEYIVIDGYSTDKTIDIVNDYLPVVDHFVSEKDTGIYNAMNKGLSLSNGKWILFLNDGDELNDVYTILDLLTVSELSDAVAFSVLLSNGETFHPSYSSKIKTRNTLHHQGLCYKRSLNIKFDEQYKVFSDFDLNQKMYKDNKNIKISNSIVTSHSLNGISHDKNVINELFFIIKNNFGFKYFLMSYLYFRLEGVKCRLRKYSF
jgi:glycosyltransferase involved in cell wall biosynthesis